MKKSLATGNKTYVKLQGAIRDDGKLHIQGEGENVNRNYGVATDKDIDINECLGCEAVEWLKALGTGKKSVVSDRKYFPLLGRNRQGCFHIQISGTQLNRPYGAAFNLYNEEVISVLRKFYENAIGE